MMSEGNLRRTAEEPNDHQRETRNWRATGIAVIKVASLVKGVVEISIWVRDNWEQWIL